MHSVAQTILDIASSQPPVPPALNIVHPRPVTWNAVIGAINAALVEEGIIGSKLPVVDFATWFSQLEQHSKNASEDSLRDIVSSKCLIAFDSHCDVLL